MKKFRVGIIGCGAIYHMHIGAISETENLEISAICDIDKEKCEAEAKKYDCPAFTDYKEMIDKCELDTVHVLTPHYLHAEMSIYALCHGVNVLTEKPMAITFSDAEKMVSAANESGMKLGVIFQNRYNTASAAVKSELESGTLGKIIGARFNVFWFRDAAYYKSGKWRGKWSTEGGGALINQSIHTLDLTNWFINSEPECVSASMANRTLRGVIEVEDEASGIIRYKNGVSASFFVCNHCRPGSGIEIEIICENGRAKIIGNRTEISYNTGKTKHIEPDSAGKTIPGKDYWGSSHGIQICAFYDSLSKGESPEIDGAEALKTQKVLCAIYESAKSGKDITF